MRLPPPYPDELLGSVFMRAAIHFGLPSPITLMSRLGVSTLGVTSLFLPAGVARIAARSNMNALRLLWDHTAFPYCVAFMPKAQAHRFEEVALGDGSKCHDSIIRLVAHCGPSLRFCKQCAVEDLVERGESYWRRSHCLPGVLRCPRHRIPLCRSVSGPRSFKQCLEVPLPHRQQEAESQSACPGWLSEALAQTARQITSENWHHRDDWHDRYRFEALSRGFRSAADRVESASMAHAFRSSVGADYLKELGLDFEEPLRSWPTLMVRAKVQALFSPAKHALLGSFLEHCSTEMRSYTYSAPGKQPRSPAEIAALDQRMAKLIHRRTQAQITKGTTTTLEQLMVDAGIWMSFKCQKHLLPAASAAVESFKRSAASKRKTGGSPEYRRRLAEIAAGRQKPMKTAQQRSGTQRTDTASAFNGTNAKVGSHTRALA